ncbi:MAG: hypothetical protein FWC33_03095 [Candidatus Bathyarchaeota archaeon]|nr:hypothetical protein [Candidatus Termiticorpusculum sp.]
MRKFISLMLLSFLILSSFITTFNAVSATDLVENSWNTKTPMNQARSDLSVVAVDGKIYAIGGQTNDGYVGTNERYDPKTDMWVTLTPMPTPRISLAIAAYDGKIYCISGGIYPEDNPEIGASWRSNVVEIYDIAANSWSTAKSPASFTGSGQAHVVDGKIFVIVGNALHMYDPATDVWTRKTDAPLFLFHPASAIVDDKIVLTGNFIVAMSPTTYALKSLIYDPKTDEWSEGKTVTTLTGRGVAVATTGVYAPQKVYVLGEDQILTYELATDNWSIVVQTGPSIDRFCAAVIDDVVYVIGGSINEQYVPIGYNASLPPTTSPPASAPVIPSEPHPNYLYRVLIVAVVGITVISLFFCFKKRTPKNSGKN